MEDLQSVEVGLMPLDTATAESGTSPPPLFGADVIYEWSLKKHQISPS